MIMGRLWREEFPVVASHQARITEMDATVLVNRSD
jgi:hypothetical protein